MGRYTGKTCRLVVMLSLTFGFFLVEIVFGYITNSMALIADSFHMLSDVLALIIAFCCMKISKKKSSKNTFGWVRAEVLGALINAVFLLALCLSIVIEALKRLLKPEKIESPINILIVGALGLLINIIGIVMFHGHASLHGHSHARPVPLNLPKEEEDLEEGEEVEKLNPIISQSHNISVLMDDNNKVNKDQTKLPSSDVISDVYSDSLLSADKQPLQNKANKKDQPTKNQTKDASGQLNMHGVFLHILGDAFGSIIVIVNAIICYYVANDAVKEYLDPSLSLVISLIITFTTLPLLKESALILLQTVPTHIDVQETKNKLLKTIDGILAVHEFHVWRLAGNKIIATAHIRCHNLDDYMKIAERVKQFFHDEGIHSTTIQPEFGEFDTTNMVHNDDACVLECPAEQCAPSTCCGPKLLSVNIVGGGAATLVGNRPPDLTLSTNNDSVIFVGNSTNSSQQANVYPSMIPEHSTSTPRRQQYNLQRRLSKSEDNLSRELGSSLLPTYNEALNH